MNICKFDFRSEDRSRRFLFMRKFCKNINIKTAHTVNNTYNTNVQIVAAENIINKLNLWIKFTGGSKESQSDPIIFSFIYIFINFHHLIESILVRRRLLLDSSHWFYIVRQPEVFRNSARYICPIQLRQLTDTPAHRSVARAVQG